MEKFKNCSEEIEALRNWVQSDKENRAFLVITAERNGCGLIVSGAMRGLTDNIVPALGEYMSDEKILPHVIGEACKYYLKKKMTSDDKGNWLKDTSPAEKRKTALRRMQGLRKSAQRQSLSKQSPDHDGVGNDLRHDERGYTENINRGRVVYAR